MNRYLFLLILSFVLSGTSASALSEKEKINILLQDVENSGLIFVRNGSEYDSRTAREHLERKLGRAGDRVKTAEQFIQYIASRSYFSNEPYYIKHKHGKKVPAAVWFQERLRMVEKRPHAKARK